MKKNQLLLGIALFLAMFLILSCQKPQMKSVSSAEFRGIPYFLPKRSLELKITYTVRQKIQRKSGYDAPIGKAEIIIVKPIQINSLILADKTQSYYLVGENVDKNAFFESGLTVNLGESGNLESIGTDFKDKSMEVFQNILTAGISLAKTLAIAGDEKLEIPQDLKDTVDKLPNIYAKISELIKDPNPYAKAKIEQLDNQVKTLYDLVKRYQENNKTFYSESEYTYSKIIDTLDLKPPKDGEPYSIEIRPTGIIKDASEAEMPPVKIDLYITKDEFDNQTKVFKDFSEGIVYRASVPIRTEVKVNAENALVYNQYLSFPQFGKHGVIPADSKRFANQNTSLVFHSQSGSIKEYKLTGGASAVNISQQLSQTVSGLQQALNDLTYTIKTQNLKNEKALIDAEAELIKARKSLEDILKSKDTTKQ